jgi:hypothetical protein
MSIPTLHSFVAPAEAGVHLAAARACHLSPRHFALNRSSKRQIDVSRLSPGRQGVSSSRSTVAAMAD